MADDLNAILDEILSVKASLAELPADAFRERIELHDRLNDLHAAAASADWETASTDALRRHVEQLEKRRASLVDRRIEPSRHDGSTGGTRIAAEQAAEPGRQIDEAADLPAIDEEIDRIRLRIAARNEG
jgi:hypothetical protein